MLKRNGIKDLSANHFMNYFQKSMKLTQKIFKLALLCHVMTKKSSLIDINLKVKLNKLFLLDEIKEIDTVLTTIELMDLIKKIDG